MKGSLCLLGFLLFAVNVYCDEGHHEMPPEVKKNHEECRKELGLTDEKPKGKDPKMKCLPACMSKKFGEMKDGKMQADKVIEKILKHHPDADKSKISSCVEKGNNEKDECEVALTSMKCLHEAFGWGHGHGHGSTTPAGFL